MFLPHICNRLSILALLCIANSQETTCDHVTVFVFPLYSVITPLIPAIDELYHNYGHKTTIVMTSKLAESSVVKKSTIDVIVSDNLDTLNISAIVAGAMETGLKGQMQFQSSGFCQEMTNFCDLILSDTKVYQNLQKRPIKLAIVSNMVFGMCFNILAYKLSVPFIHYGQFYDPVNERIPYSASFVPAYPVVTFSDNMTFLERIINCLLFSSHTLIQDAFSPSRAVEKYAPEKQYISTPDLWKQAEFHLLEFDILMDYPRPMFQNYALIGGIGTKPAQSLKKYFLDFLDPAMDGVVIVSFGSIATDFPEAITSKFLESFSRLRSIKFVFKQGNTSYTKQNVLFSPWIPQNDLLGHRNTKLFITHCGNSGQFESLYHGVPMIGFPLFWEQHSNARRMEEKGFGITMKINEFTADDLVKNINEVLLKEKYRSAISRASVIFKSRPDTPNQRMAYWINHILKYGGKYMRPRSLDMPLFAYFMLDVFLVLLSFIVSVVCCFRFVYVFLIRKLAILKKKTD